jgi:hypothetical protein
VWSDRQFFTTFTRNWPFITTCMIPLAQRRVPSDGSTMAVEQPLDARFSSNPQDRQAIVAAW